MRNRGYKLQVIVEWVETMQNKNKAFNMWETGDLEGNKCLRKTDILKWFKCKCVCIFVSGCVLPGAGGVCRYTSSLYSPNPALLQPRTLRTYTLSISSLSITALVPPTSSRRCQEQWLPLLPELPSDHTLPHNAPAPPTFLWYSTE